MQKRSWHTVKGALCVLLAVTGLALGGGAEGADPFTMEEIIVTAEAPADMPLATVSLIGSNVIDTTSSRHLGELLNLTSGTYVSEGAKRESMLRIRGFESRQTTLLLDGAPVYEPYFHSFDLNHFPAGTVESIKIIKGASSVLYGPNTMGGIVNVITRRPRESHGQVEVRAAENDTWHVSGSGAHSGSRSALFGSAVYDTSDGYDWRAPGGRRLRENSDYEDLSLLAKLYAWPSEDVEALASVSYVDSEYGLPIATEYYRKRFWRFSDWEQLVANAGATFPAGNSALLKARAYFVRHENALDAFRTEAFEEKTWVSTYKNDSYGAFLLGDLATSDGNDLRLSLHARSDRSKQQSDIGEPWESFTHETYSIGAEDEYRLADAWRIVAGASVDYLEKAQGANDDALNPMIGLKYDPDEHLGIHVSASRKSRFPSMRALYSSRGGNPDLEEETARTYEAGVTYRDAFRVSGAVFHSDVDDLITSVRGLSGYQSFMNVAEAEVTGFEIELEKDFGPLSVNVNYTFLDSEDKDTGRPLDLLPESQFNVFARTAEVKGFAASAWAIAVSEAETVIDEETVEASSYVVANLQVEKRMGNATLYVKAENLFDETYAAEPGFPMPARTIYGGAKVRF
jgi:iron complex outermembrane receptor protein